MIVMGSGHREVQQFAKSQKVLTRLVGSWSELIEICPKADRVLIGERLPGRPPWDQVQEFIASYQAIQWLIWIPKDEQGAIGDAAGAEIVLGDLSSERLLDWLSPRLEPERQLVLPKRWVLWRPYLTGENDIVPAMTAEAKRQHGRGVWIDLDWQLARLTAALHIEAWERPLSQYEKLKPYATEWGGIVPAPPPWSIIFDMPSAADIHTFLIQDYAWCGVDIGANFRTQLAMSALGTIRNVVVLSNGSNTKILQEGLQSLLTLRPDFEILGIGSERLAKPVIEHAGGTWHQMGEPLTAPTRGLKKIFNKRLPR